MVEGNCFFVLFLLVSVYLYELNIKHLLLPLYVRAFLCTEVCVHGGGLFGGFFFYNIVWAPRVRRLNQLSYGDPFWEFFAFIRIG